LIIGTFGRAAYILDDITPLREMAASEQALLDEPLKLIHATPGYQVSYSQPRGIRFPGDQHWRGDNKGWGVRASMWARIDGKGDAPTIGKDEEKPTGKDEKAMATVRIMSLGGDTLRHYEFEVDTTGVHTFGWGMDTNGIHYPSWNSPKEDKLPPGGGMSVAPGTYSMVVEFKGERDSLEVKVMDDPRNPSPSGAYEASKARYERWAAAVTTAQQGFEMLKDAQETIGKMRKQYAAVEDSLKTQMTTLADSLSKSIVALQERYMLPKGTKGYHYEGDLLSTHIWSARSYLTNGNEMPGQNGEHALAELERRVADLRTDINALFDGVWMEWRKEVEALEMPPLFEDVKKLD
jgi:hypothetical protein